jgi:4-hydroxythreonine-4-phosphate dehydrogenase
MRGWSMFLLLLLPCLALAQKAELVDRIVAVVNKEVITNSELNAAIASAERQLRRQGTAVPPRAVLERQILERLVVDRAQLQKARDTGIRVDDVQLDRAVQRIAENNKMTLADFRSTLERDNVPFDAWRADLRDQILVSRLREREVEDKIQVNDSEIDLFLEELKANPERSEYNVSHILVRVPEGASPERIEEARARAQKALAEARESGDFARVAAAYSDAPDALEGGNLGWRAHERLPEIFSGALAKMKPGEVSAPAPQRHARAHRQRHGRLRRARQGELRRYRQRRARRRARLDLSGRHRPRFRARAAGAQAGRDLPAGEDAVRLSPHPGPRAPLLGRQPGAPPPRGAQGAARAEERGRLPGLAEAAPRPGLRGAAPGGAIAARPVIALTSGEPAGVGPELCVRLAAERFNARLVAIGDRSLLTGFPEIEHVPLVHPRVPGKLDPANSRYVLAVLERALAGCLSGEYHAMVTAPLQKSVINDAGIAFTGHTEFLAEKARADHVVMMLVGGGLRVALATTHLPLAEVPRAITPLLITKSLKVLDEDLRKRFRIAKPRILVAGLNPHSGESGHLGREDLEIIAPAVSQSRQEAIDAAGPIPADTLFVPERLKQADAVLAMYHDQGLPVLKYASFGRGVNVTLGLPFVRTSVDHGTALDLAGTGKADPGSLIEAVRLAIELASAA